MSSFETFQVRGLSLATDLRFAPELINEAIGILTATFGTDWLLAKDPGTASIPMGLGGHPLRRDLQLAGEVQVMNVLEIAEYLKTVPGATDPIVVANLKSAFGKTVLQLAFSDRLLLAGAQDVRLEPPVAAGRVGDIGFAIGGRQYIAECYSPTIAGRGDLPNEQIRLINAIMVVIKDYPGVVSVAIRLASPLMADHRKAITRAVRSATPESLTKPRLLRIANTVVSLGPSIRVGAGEDSALVLHDEFDGSGEPDSFARASYVRKSQAFKLTSRNLEGPTGSHVALWLDAETRARNSMKKPLERDLERLATKAERKLGQTRYVKSSGRLLVINSWIAHEFHRAAPESVERLKNKLVRAHRNVEGVLIVGRSWQHKLQRHRYLIHVVADAETTGGNFCNSLRSQESELVIPPILAR